MVRLEGIVLDKQSGEPVASATVRVGNRGVITNSDGRFLLQLTRSLVENQLRVSHIGYQDVSLELGSIPDPGKITIRLEENTNQLKEVVVSADARWIVEKAVAAIPHNYPQETVSLIGFFRESNRVPGGAYLYLAEGVLQTNVSPYQPKAPESEVRILKQRMKEFADRDTMLQITYGGSARLPAILDVVHQQEDFVNDLLKKKKYQFVLTDVIVTDGQEVYIIDFKSVDSGKKEAVTGRLYITTQTYAFVHMELTIRPYGVEKNTAVGVTREYVKTRISYQFYAGRWYLQTVWYTQENTGASLGRKTRNQLVLEYVTTGIDTVARPRFSYAERVQRGDVFSKQEGSFDEQFWQNYNHILLGDELQRQIAEKERQELAKVTFAEGTTPQSAVSHVSGVIPNTGKSHQAGNRIGVAVRKLLSSAYYDFGVGFIPIGNDMGPVAITYGHGSFAASSQRELPIFGFGIGLRRGIGFRIVPQTAVYLNTTSNFGLGYGLVLGQRNYGAYHQFVFNRQGRPIRLGLGMAYSRFSMRYRLGTFNNDETFTVDNKQLEASRIRVDTQKEVRALLPTLSASIELTRRREFYIEAGYVVPLGETERFRLREKQGLFLSRKTAYEALSTDNSMVKWNEEGVDRLLPHRLISHLTVSIGLRLKLMTEDVRRQ